MEFEDPTFEGDSALSGVRIPDDRKPIRWLRPRELKLRASVQPQLFGTIKAENIRQGALGDCWLLACFAIFAESPGHITSLFKEVSPGQYSINLWDIQKGWEEVEIDDRIPCDKYGNPLFAQVERETGSFWAVLLEKAVAKFAGSYGGLKGGNAAWAAQVLTGQAYQMHWSPNDEGTCWKRWSVAKEMDKLQRGGETERLQWRFEGMRRISWRGPEERILVDEAFELFTSYSQASYLMTCSVSGQEVEGKRPDGLLTRHAYSLLQLVEAYGHRLVQLRNPWGKGGEWRGPWSDSSNDWLEHSQISTDLGVMQPGVFVNDGIFWMPWADFHQNFSTIDVCPVTLPCPRNSYLGDEDEVSSLRGSGPMFCPLCRQRHTRSWVLLVDGTWHNLTTGSLCFLCLRATSRATTPPLQLAGVHQPPKASVAPPQFPKRLQLCKNGLGCNRRNPFHFANAFHPWLLPPAPGCSACCGRSASSGYLTCCKACTGNPPDLEVQIPGGRQKLSGVYKPVPGKTLGGAPVFRLENGNGWLWKHRCWIFAYREPDASSSSGHVSSSVPARMPQLVTCWQVPKPKEEGGGWHDDPFISVNVAPGSAQRLDHSVLCESRAARESELVQQADELLVKFAAVVPPPAPAGAPPAATCRRPDCGLPTWSGQTGEFCTRACRDKQPAICRRRGCTALTYNGRPGFYCSPACRDQPRGGVSAVVV